jgi:hypothetical protein
VLAVELLRNEQEAAEPLTRTWAPSGLQDEPTDAGLGRLQTDAEATRGGSLGRPAPLSTRTGRDNRAPERHKKG